jgi:hypothetical protein
MELSNHRQCSPRTNLCVGIAVLVTLYAGVFVILGLIYS